MRLESLTAVTPSNDTVMGAHDLRFKKRVSDKGDPSIGIGRDDGSAHDTFRTKREEAFAVVDKSFARTFVRCVFEGIIAVNFATATGTPKTLWMVL
jgi:hypothetical protein